MNGSVPAPSPVRRAHGLSLIEVLVALGIFAVVCVGVLSVLGATTAGGFQDASLMALTTGRRAKDLTVAAVYLQALHDHLASQDETVWNALLSTWPPGVNEQAYCVAPGRSSCGGSEPTLPGVLGDYPLPQAAPYQMAWTTLRVVVQRWHWDCAARRYTAPPAATTPDLLVHVRSMLSWRFKGETRTLTPEEGGVGRFLPYGPLISTPADESCP